MDKTQIFEYAMQYLILPLLAAVGWLLKRIGDQDKRITALEADAKNTVTYKEMQETIDKSVDRIEDKLDSIEKYLREK